LRQDKLFAEIQVRRIRPVYPAGEPVALVHACTGRMVRAGATVADKGCVVLTPSTLAAITAAVNQGTPLCDRIVTVAGAGIGKPANLRVPVGTLLCDVLAACEADESVIKKVIMGGPFSGTACAERTAPVLKTTTAVITLDTITPAEQVFDCIHCTACFQVCPRRLVPAVLAESVRANDLDKAAAWGISHCMQCGCCAYVCPSKINLTHYIALGNYHLNRRKSA
jgi:electron transport complex protein RnfC